MTCKIAYNWHDEVAIYLWMLNFVALFSFESLIQTIRYEMGSRCFCVANQNPLHFVILSENEYIYIFFSSHCTVVFYTRHAIQELYTILRVKWANMRLIGSQCNKRKYIKQISNTGLSSSLMLPAFPLIHSKNLANIISQLWVELILRLLMIMMVNTKVQ